MGTFFATLRVIGPSGEMVTLQGAVDTGAMFTVLPADLLERLGVEPIGTVPVRFADGATQSWRLGEVQAELMEVRRPILCLFGSSDAPPLIGAHTLEAFLLSVDLVEQKLVPKEALLMNAGRNVECIKLPACTRLPRSLALPATSRMA